jgi:energy-coupling factor transporter ATP-binding protein EcfA2
MHFIENFAVEGFRGLTDLRVRAFGRVNLITGKNNSGKSSLLEAIRVLASAGSLQTLRDILDYREELNGLDSDSPIGRMELSAFSTLFGGCPDLASKAATFSISAEGSISPSSSNIRVSTGWFIRKVDADQRTVNYESAHPDFFGDEEILPALEIKIGERSRVVPFDRFLRRPLFRNEPEVAKTPVVYLDPFSSRSTSQLSAMWDAIALTDLEIEVVSALKIISADIEAVSMIGSDERIRRGRTAIAKGAGFSLPVPLRTFGDGVNRFFGIILSLCNAKNGILLVDELENGLHYSVQVDVWRTIFRLSRKLNVQVFATSHSLDCVRSFQEASVESDQEGVLLRLTKRGGNVIPTIFSEDELKIASRNQIEVR